MRWFNNPEFDEGRSILLSFCRVLSFLIWQKTAGKIQLRFFDR